MLEKTIAEYKKNMRSPVLGDIEAGKLISYYLEQRNKILQYKGKSAVDRRKFEYYESKLIEDDYRNWFSRYSKAQIDRELWLLRRLKVGISPRDEYNLINDYYDRLPLTDLIISQYDKNSLAADANLKKYFIKHGVIKG